MSYENGIKFDTYINPSAAHLYGKNPYGAYMGPQNADEWETFGDILGASEIPLVAQAGDLISLGANVYKGSAAGMAISAAAFVPFGSEVKLAAKGGTNALVKSGVEISEHATLRMSERGITQSMVETGLSKGGKYFDPKNGTFNYVLKNGFASGNDLLIGTNTVTGRVTTVLRGSNLVKPRFIPQ